MDSNFILLLSDLPNGSNIAIVAMMGSFCPPTKAHIQCFEEGRRALMSNAANLVFQQVLGLAAFNDDDTLSAKLTPIGEQYIPWKGRATLMNHAATELPWLKISWSIRYDIEVLRWYFPHLNFFQYQLNGADDVVNKQKWLLAGYYNRFITIGRPGYTELVQEACAQRVRNANLDPDHFILGREVELSMLSSTVARRALRAIDRHVLATCLHQSVCEWCLENNACAFIGDLDLSRCRICAIEASVCALKFVDGVCYFCYPCNVGDTT